MTYHPALQKQIDEHVRLAPVHEFLDNYKFVRSPLIIGLHQFLHHLLLAQREAEYRLLATCWVGESNEKGFAARLLADFDLSSLVTESVRKVLTAWKHCPLEDRERRFIWLWALLFAHDLLFTAMKHSCDYLPSQASALLERITDLHQGLLAFDRLGDWLDDPINLVHVGQTPILTASSETAAGATVNDSVGIQVDASTNRDWLTGELLAARPEFVVLTDDLPEAAQFRTDLEAAGLKAYLYSEKTP